MRSIDRFERFGQKIYNGQDVLKNLFLDRYPIHYTDNPGDLSFLSQYTDDYVWVVDKNIEVLTTFPFWLKPKELAIHVFPYIYKHSKRIKSWDKVKLVPTKIHTEKIVEYKYICGIYDFYCGKDRFDIFFIGNKNTGTWEQLIKRFPNSRAIDTYQQAAELSETDMFWLVPDDVEIQPWFNFSYQPDDWSHEFTHVFGNGKKDTRDGIALFPKNYKPTDRELKYRYYANKKEMKIIASKPLAYEKFSFKNYAEYTDALANSKTEMFWYIPTDVEVTFDFNLYFDHQNQYDRTINHVFLNADQRDGIVLFSKNSPVTEKEFEHRFYVNKKEWDIVASVPKKYSVYTFKDYNEYVGALENSETELFWNVPSDVKVFDSFDFNLAFHYNNRFDRNINHVFLNDKKYNGIILFSKNTPVTKKEFDFRFPLQRKEWNILASKFLNYEKFNFKNYDEYLDALQNSKTELFWHVSKNIKNVDFSFRFAFENLEDRTFNHMFLTDGKYSGITLYSKNAPITKKEFEHQFPVKKKEWDIDLILKKIKDKLTT